MNDRQERIAEVFVFAPSEAVPSHDNAAAEDRLLRIEKRDRLALVCGEDVRQQGASLLVEVFPNLTPIERVDACDSSFERNRAWAGSLAPTIGLLLCETHNSALAEYALRDVAKPIGVSTYRVTRELPAPVRDELPTVEDLQEVVAKLRSEMEQLRKERDE